MNADESVRDVIDRLAEAASGSDKPFIIDPERASPLTYLDLQQQARAVAHFISRQGIAPGASVAYAMGNSSCCAATVLGIMYGGYRAVAINLMAGRDVIAYVLDHSQTVLVLCSSDTEALINDAVSVNTECAELHIQCMDNNIVNAWVAQNSTAVGANVSASHDALLMYTSGTTGRPKGVTLSHGNVLAGGYNVVTGHKLEASDRALCVLPLYHINGLCVTVFGPLVSGGSLVLPERFSTSAFWQLVDEHQCSWFSVVPTQVSYLLRDADKQKTPSTSQRAHLRFGRSASAPLSPDMHGAFEKRFAVPLIETMGLTETSAQILTNPLPPHERKLGARHLLKMAGCVRATWVVKMNRVMYL